jgi:two-component system phosphate regulon sensor histidine kinase PhoR
MGLSPEEQKKVFRQFYRVDKKLSRSRDGLGIGLSIVRRLVDALGAMIQVESEKGKGSAFTVSLGKGGAG